MIASCGVGLRVSQAGPGDLSEPSSDAVPGGENAGPAENEGNR